MDTVSVIIPNYNRSGTLIRAVKSVLAQHVLVLEILVCDDGSTDDSHEQIKALSNPLIKWIDCGRNGRPAIPRNSGIKHSKGDWLAFLDNDDEWLPEKIEEQLRVAKENKSFAICTNAMKIQTDGKKDLFFQTKDTALNFDSMISANGVICSSMIIHRSLLDKTIGFPEARQLRALEDYALWLRISCLHSIQFVARPLVNYYDDAENSIRKEDLSHWKQRELVLTDLIKWMKNTGINKDFQIKAKRELQHARISRLKSTVKKLFR